MKQRLLIALPCLGLFALLGQEDAPARAGLVRVKQTTALRAQPQLSSPRLKDIEAGAELRWVAGQKKSGFFRVVTTKGPQGWILAEHAEVAEEPPSLLSLESAGEPCAETLKACPETGCSATGSEHALFNAMKRRLPSPGAELIHLNFAALASLQEKADAVVGQGSNLSKEERDSLADLNLNGKSVGEGSFVRVTGFVGAQPRANSGGESVNCKLKTAKNNDFHVSITKNKTDTEFEGLVVEMIPQKRPAGWTITKLSKLKTQRRKVLVSGKLFYDNIHFVNGDPANNIPGQPKRFTVWEIHPVTEFQVCKNLSGPCDPDTGAHWMPLTSF